MQKEREKGLADSFTLNMPVNRSYFKREKECLKAIKEPNYLYASGNTYYYVLCMFAFGLFPLTTGGA
jgi:hypothetical protein